MQFRNTLSHNKRVLCAVVQLRKALSWVKCPLVGQNAFGHFAQRQTVKKPHNLSSKISKIIWLKKIYFVFLTMQYIQGISRNQLQMGSLEDKITADNSVRFIDAFVGVINLEKLGFQLKILKKEGRPCFQTEVFLKLYLYGYLNGARSSRKLEKECIRNIEMQWLLEDIRPNYHSIHEHKKNNIKA